MKYFIFTLCIYSVLLNCRPKSDEEPTGHLSVQGYYATKKLNHIVNAKVERMPTSINIWINQDDLYSKLPLNLAVIHIEGLSQSINPKAGEYLLSDNPESDNVYKARIGIRTNGACSLVSWCKSGRLKIITWTDEIISGELFMGYSLKEKIQCQFEVSVINRIAEIPLPIRRLNGTEVKFREISDDFPNDGLKFKQIILSGKVKESDFDSVDTDGKILLSTDKLTIDANTKTDLEWVRIKVYSENIFTKIRIGTFKILPRSIVKDEKKVSIEYNLSNNEFMGVTDCNAYYKQIEGILKITAYSQSAIAGEYDVNIIDGNKIVSNIKAKFKLPIIIR